jgi:hypothetical protein
VLKRLDLHSRARAAGIHLLLTATVAALAAVLVFGLWYPGAYRQLSGGRELFLLVVGVDLALGPLLTFSVFDVRKGWKHLRRDLATIGLIQMAALAYGVHTVWVARPMAMVFETDRFRVITANNVYLPELPKARPEYRSLPVTGPWLLGVRPAAAGEERNDAMFMALDGVDTGQRPPFWQPYSESVSAVLAKSRLLAHYPDGAAEFRAALQEMKASETDSRFLPLVARGDWVVVIDAAGKVLGYLSADGFF